MLELAVSGAVIGAGVACLVWEALLRRQERQEEAELELEAERPRFESWVDDFGQFTVTVLPWERFHEIATHGGRDAFAGSWAKSQEEAERLGLDVWRQHGSFWLEHQGRIYRSEHPLV